MATASSMTGASEVWQRVAWCADKDNAQATTTKILLKLEALVDRDERIILGLGRFE